MVRRTPKFSSEVKIFLFILSVIVIERSHYVAMTVIIIGMVSLYNPYDLGLYK